MRWLPKAWFGGSEWDIDAVTPPWDDRSSIYAFLRGLPPETDMGRLQLPDHEAVRGRTGFGWVPGALDGAFGHHAKVGGAKDPADAVKAALIELTTESTAANADALYDLLLEHSAMDYVDALLEAIVEHGDWPADRLYRVAEWLATGAPDREPVKIGIAILGIFQGGEGEDLLLELGRHEEFTLFCVVGLQNTVDDWERALWDLGKEVTGWGRIHVVERLAGTTDEHIQSWLLREGCRNDIMPEYTALICAETGGLAEALALPEPDDDLVHGARVILSALTRGRGGPASGLESYEDGPLAVERFLEILSARSLTIEDFVLLHQIRRFLKDEDEAYGSGAERWSAVRMDLGAKVDALLDRDEWPRRVRRAVEAEGDDFFVAIEAADILGVDIWDVHFRRLQGGEEAWYHVMQTDDRERAERVVAHAEATLPLAEIAIGPAKELGMGPEWSAHGALDFVLQELGRFPGLGWPLIKAGLESPVIRNRNMALRALEGWESEEWPADAIDVLGHAIEREPVEETRERMEEVLAEVERKR